MDATASTNEVYRSQRRSARHPPPKDGGEDLCARVSPRFCESAKKNDNNWLGRTAVLPPGRNRQHDRHWLWGTAVPPPGRNRQRDRHDTIRFQRLSDQSQVNRAQKKFQHGKFVRCAFSPARPLCRQAVRNVLRVGYKTKHGLDALLEEECLDVSLSYR